MPTVGEGRDPVPSGGGQELTGDRCSSAVMQTLHWSAVVKTELSQTAKLLIYQSVFVPPLICGYKL